MSVIDQTWRDAMASACEARADVVADCLAHVENVGQCMEDATELVGVGRAYAGHLRTVRNDLLSEARTLRSKGGDAA